jgi:hypothetical protein
MAVMDADFQRLADWCLKPTDKARLKRVVGAQLNWYTGEEGVQTVVVALWSGYLDFHGRRSRVLGEFHGTLGVLPAPHRDPVELWISVLADRASAGMTGKGIAPAWSEAVPISVYVVEEDQVVARIETGDPSNRLWLFLSPTYNYAD